MQDLPIETILVRLDRIETLLVKLAESVSTMGAVVDQYETHLSLHDSELDDIHKGLSCLTSMFQLLLEEKDALFRAPESPPSGE